MLSEQFQRALKQLTPMAKKSVSVNPMLSDLKRNRLQSTAYGKFPQHSRWVPDGLKLIAKEDIYAYSQGKQPILLIRGGQQVSDDLLEKLIRYGAAPNQFILEKISENEEIAGVSQIKSTQKPPFMLLPSSLRRAQQLFQDKILIYENNDKAQQRLTDCLMSCGFSLPDIHLVRVPEQLVWSIAKYKPALLFIDLNAGGARNGLRVIHELLSKEISDAESIHKILLTVDLPSKDEKYLRKITEAAADLGVTPMFKPLNRFLISSVLESLHARK